MRLWLTAVLLPLQRASLLRHPACAAGTVQTCWRRMRTRCGRRPGAGASTAVGRRSRRARWTPIMAARSACIRRHPHACPHVLNAPQQINVTSAVAGIPCDADILTNLCCHEAFVRSQSAAASRRCCCKQAEAQPHDCPSLIGQSHHVRRLVTRTDGMRRLVTWTPVAPGGICR